MANVKISALPAATSALVTDEFPINQGGTTKKVTLEQIQNLGGVKVTLDQMQNYIKDKVLTLGTAVSATGTSVQFTGIPSTAKQITVFLDNVSTNGASTIQIQLGTESGYVTSGYKSNVTTSSSTTSLATGIIILYASDASWFANGVININMFSGFKYITSGTSSLVNSIGGQFVNTGSNSGIVTLNSVIDRLRITTVNGTDTFDSGTINIRWL